VGNCKSSMTGDQFFTASEINRMISEVETQPIDEKEALSAFNCVERKIDAIERRSRSVAFMNRLSRVAAILLIPISILATYLLVNDSSDVRWSELSVPLGQTRDIVLGDGTHISVNAGSRVTYPSGFNSSIREIFVDGQIVANVAKDKRKPFIIHTNDLDVTVLGTELELKAYSESKTSELYLFNGSVKMTSISGNKTINLTPGETVQYDMRTKSFEKSSFDGLGYKTFLNVDGFVFKQIEFRDACSELERRFGWQIVITDERLASRKIFGLFSNGESLDKILESLFYGQINVVRHNDVVYISPQKI